MDKFFLSLGNDYLSAAHNYARAAEFLLDTPQEYFKEKKCNFLNIVPQILAQAAEVCLKAALAYMGHNDFKDIKGVAKEHRLNILISECEKYGIQIDSDFRTYSAAISENYSRHDYRYPRTFSGFTEDESCYLDFLSTGKWQGKYLEDKEAGIIEKKMANMGLVVKSSIPIKIYISSIDRQINIISVIADLTEKKTNASN